MYQYKKLNELEVSYNNNFFKHKKLINKYKVLPNKHMIEFEESRKDLHKKDSLTMLKHFFHLQLEKKLKNDLSTMIFKDN